MNKYYTLVLNNCSDLGIHFISNDYCTMIPNILEKTYTDLSTLEKDFMELHDTVIINENNWYISGSFPVIGMLKEGKMYDVITGKEIAYTQNSKEVKGLSYSQKYEANHLMVELLFSSLSEEERQKYVSYINKIEEKSKKVASNCKFKETYYLLKPNNINVDIPPIIAKCIDGEYIDVFTKRKIIEIGENTITSKLSFKFKRQINLETANKYQLDIIDIGVSKYIENINRANQNAIREYNNYMSFNKYQKFSGSKKLKQYR